MDLKQNNLTKKAMKVSAGALATLSILSNSAFALSPRDIVKKAKSLVAPTVAAVATTAAAASVIGVTGVLVWKLIDLKGEEVEVPIDINDLIDKIDLTTRKKMLESFKSVGECLRLEEKEAFKRSCASLEKNVREDDYESKFEENYKKTFLCCMGFALGVQPFTDNNDNRTLSNEERILNCIKSAIEDGKINVPNKPQSMGEQQPEENKGTLGVNKEESVGQIDPASQPVKVEDEGTVFANVKTEILDVTTEENEAEEEDTQTTETDEEKSVVSETVEDKSKQEADAKSEEEQKVGSDTAAEEKKTEESSVEKAPVEENNTPVVDEAKKEDKLPEEVTTVDKGVSKEEAKPLTEKERKKAEKEEKAKKKAEENARKQAEKAENAKLEELKNKINNVNLKGLNAGAAEALLVGKDCYADQLLSILNENVTKNESRIVNSLKGIVNIGSNGNRGMTVFEEAYRSVNNIMLSIESADLLEKDETYIEIYGNCSSDVRKKIKNVIESLNDFSKKCLKMDRNEEDVKILVNDLKAYNEKMLNELKTYNKKC